MPSCLHQFRWLYLLALLQLLGGPLVVSVLMQMGGGETTAPVMTRSDGPSSSSTAVWRSSEMPLGGEPSEVCLEDWQGQGSKVPVDSGKGMPKGKMQWSLEDLEPLRIFPPMAVVTDPEGWSEKGRSRGSGPPVPPPRRV